MTVAFHRPTTVAEVLARLAEDEDAHLIAGGVSVVLLMSAGLMEPGGWCRWLRSPSCGTGA